MNFCKSISGTSKCSWIISRQSTILILLTCFTFISSYARAESDLTKAAFDGDIKAVKALLAKGADVNAKNDDNITALFMAAYKGHLEVVKVLLANGADADMKTKSGNDTALIVASQNGFPDVVKTLLKNKADVNAKNNNGATGLILASFKGDTEVVKTLLAAGADVNIKTYNDQTTALSAAERGGYPEVVQLLKNAGAKKAASKTESFELPDKSFQTLVELVPLKKLGIKGLFVATEKDIAKKWPDKWPAVFPSGIDKLEVMAIFTADPAYGVSLKTRITSESGKLELMPQGPPARFSLGGSYYLEQEITPSKGNFVDGVYICIVQLNGKNIAKIKLSIGSKKRVVS